MIEKTMQRRPAALFAGIFMASQLVLNPAAFGAEKPQPIPGLLQSKLNLALTAKVEASSTEKGYTPLAVVDGVAQGYPEKGRAEWSSNGETTGAKVKLIWVEPVTIETVWLFDRPLPKVQVLDAQIDFSDGTSAMVGELPNNGATPFQLNFPEKIVTWMEVIITRVGQKTMNACRHSRQQKSPATCCAIRLAASPKDSPFTTKKIGWCSATRRTCVSTNPAET